MENTKKKTVWIADLYRCGYDLVVVEETKDKARLPRNLMKKTTNISERR